MSTTLEVRTVFPRRCRTRSIRMPRAPYGSSPQAGIDNFHDLKVATYSMREGLSAAGASSVLASPAAQCGSATFEPWTFCAMGGYLRFGRRTICPD